MRLPIPSLRPPRPFYSLVVAIVGPLIVTIVGGWFGVETASAAVLFLLAVVVAAALAGAFAGMCAAVVSFLGLNYFFTPPVHTLRVDKTADLVALVAFLAVSLIVGGLLARANEARAAAERGQQEARLLADIGEAFLAGSQRERTLARVPARIRHLVGATSCVIDVPAAEDREPLRIADGEPHAAADAHRLEAPITGFAGATIAVAGPREFDGADGRALKACAQEIGLGMERERLDAQVHRTLLEAEATKLQSALFSSVTHDLRTPLASIKAGVSSLLDGSAHLDADQQRELLQTTLEETDRLNRLLGNILDLAKIRAGALALTKEPTHLDEIVEAVISRLRAHLNGHPVRTVARPELPAIPVDPVLIDQVFTNLIENAARFSPAGSEIVISAAVWHSDLEVRVADQGPGVPIERRDAIFEPFERGDAGDGRAGSGLGLAIVRAIVLAHEGDIWVEGSPAGGATIVFRLPVLPA